MNNHRYYNDPTYDPDSQSPRDMRDLRPWWRVVWDAISDGGPRGQPFDPADAAGVKSGTVTTYGQTGRPNRAEIGAEQIPGSSMSSGLARPIVAEQARGPSEALKRASEWTVDDSILLQKAMANCGMAVPDEGSLETLAFDHVQYVRRVIRIVAERGCPPAPSQHTRNLQNDLDVDKGCQS